MDEQQLSRLEKLFKALADPARLRILGLLAERPHAGHELAARLELTPPTISHHMRRLVDAGLVAVTAHAQARVYTLQPDELRGMSKELRTRSEQNGEEREEDAVLRAFFEGPRLKQIPASRKKRVVVLRHLLKRFDPETAYSEREVNDLLRPAHEDVATLRRELVDYGFMVRKVGIYRVATALPERGSTVQQEVGDESDWLRTLVTTATTRAVKYE